MFGRIEKIDNTSGDHHVQIGTCLGSPSWVVVFEGLKIIVLQSPLDIVLALLDNVDNFEVYAFVVAEFFDNGDGDGVEFPYFLHSLPLWFFGFIVH